ncbi:MAG: hypothetical protein ACETWG_08885 [Candidatus Neomarinimicrobiota bacterium]
MRPWILRFVCLGGLLVFLSCPAALPDLQQALVLYRQGHLNEARRDMVSYIRAKPFNPETEEARQHVLVIRRIKRMEARAVKQWLEGDTQGAKRTIGVLRVLHPVYVDSAEVFRLIDFDRPPAWLADTTRAAAPTRFDPSDSTFQVLLPYARAVLDRQGEVIILLAREWETAKYQCKDSPVQRFATSISKTGILEPVRAVKSAREELREAAGEASPLNIEIDHLSEQFDEFLSFITSDTLQPPHLFEYDFQGYKRELLQQILALKARLFPVEAVPAAATDTAAVTGS